MKLAYSKYTLIEKGTRLSKEGAILRIELAKEKFGYADIHPCKVCGDLPLKDQLSLLGKRQKTPLTSQSLIFAKYDALARKENKYLLKDLPIPQSNTTIVNEEQNLEDAIKSSSVVKIKMGIDWKDRVDNIRSFLALLQLKSCLLRLDFGESLTKDSFSSFLETNEDLLPFIDYIEDPYPYNPTQWENTRKKHTVRLGCDRNVFHALRHPTSCDVLVVKPASQPINDNLFRCLHHRQLVITSYLDHPIGQLCAAYVAAGAKRIHGNTVSVCGLITHQVFEETPFSQRLNVQNGCLIAPKKGYGWGFDDLLKGMTWVLL